MYTGTSGPHQSGPGVFTAGCGEPEGKSMYKGFGWTDGHSSVDAVGWLQLILITM